MPGGRCRRRIDTIELKLQIEMRLGRQKTEQYFNLLSKFLSLKITKSDFDKLCIGLFGKESVTLHNGFIRAIIRNAHVSKSPPPKHENGKTSLNVKIPNKYQRSPLGTHNVGYQDSPVKYQEQQSATELLSLGSRPPLEVTSVEEGEEIEQHSGSPGIHSRSPLRAPIGVSIKAKGKKEMLLNGSLSSLDMETCYKNGELPDTSSLRKRLEQKLETEGLDVSTDCVNLLNNGLDVFMKRLLKPCVDLASLKKEVSLTEFGVEMELNPQILGENWPELLEKVLCASGNIEHKVGVHQKM